MFDSDERTFAATPQRRKQARDEGRVVASRHVTSAIVWLACCGGIYWFAPQVGTEVVELTRSQLASPLSGLDRASAMGLWQSAAATFVRCVAPLSLSAAILASIVHALQTGWLWRPQRVAPDWCRLSPAAGWRRMITFATGIEALWLLAQLLVVVAMCGWLFFEWAEPLSQLVLLDDQPSRQQIARLFGSWAARVGGILVVFGLLHYAVRWWQFEEQLKMSSEDLRAEIRAIGDGKGATEKGRRSATTLGRA